MRHDHARHRGARRQAAAAARDRRQRLAAAQHLERGTENLYSAWIEKLFDAPLDAALSWPALHEVLRDRSRNFLFNHLGLSEDSMGLVIRPDCADLPYFLRAYFAFKMGLPFGYSKCTRGGGGKPPRCRVVEHPEPNRRRLRPSRLPRLRASRDRERFRHVRRRRAADSATPPPKPPAPRPRPSARARGLASATISAQPSPTAFIPDRAEPRSTDNNTDYYPVPLTQETLRPAPSMPIRTDISWCSCGACRRPTAAAGVFLAVDAQPDGTVARKRFWRGNFLFATDPALGGPGFKRFRPIVRRPERRACGG